MQFSNFEYRLKMLKTHVLYGSVCDCVGLIIEADGPKASIGSLCDIHLSSGDVVQAEVVGFRQGKLLIMPYFGNVGVSRGDKVVFNYQMNSLKVGVNLLGRVVDAFVNPLDGKGDIQGLQTIQIGQRKSSNPLDRSPINEVLTTGIKSIDAFTTIGKGQRLGLMSGSGVGKSVLLSSICKNVDADINVIALIGERGREVEEFVNATLGQEGLKKSVVVSATAQDSPLVRAKAAFNALAIAEYFANQGRSVFFTMDSITRLASALREIGLAVGEPPTVKGYTPSVFAVLPEYIERFGKFKNGGSISSLLTVLVESDDFNDPIVDCVRAVLDGHIVLTRELAEQAHFPAVDISKSVSRLATKLQDNNTARNTQSIRKFFFDYQQNKEVIELGLFESGDDKNREDIKKNWSNLRAFLTQGMEENFPFEQTMGELDNIGSLLNA
ncbi:FliI/YscN family ATPase [Agaribacter flavus]|uniref:protein-secreting ATPase n=1 Tax=Agaribacter flavus TaxID=1902781 RepID=A0ABV7FSP2_9ALTE